MVFLTYLYGCMHGICGSLPRSSPGIFNEKEKPMTLEELRDIILERINLSEQHSAEQFRQVDTRIDQNARHTEAQFREVNAQIHQSETRTTERIDQSETRTTERIDQSEARTTERIDLGETRTTERIDQSEKHTAEQFREVNARFDRSDARADRQDAKIDTVIEAVTERREVAAVSRGERLFTRRFWKHIAWIVPTLLALIALLKSFFG